MSREDNLKKSLLVAGAFCLFGSLLYHRMAKKTQKQGAIILLSGPSGVGKSTIITHLGKSHNFSNIVSYTTRDMRAGEEKGKSYHFITQQEFAEADKKDEFLVTLNFGSNSYGAKTADFHSLTSQGKHVAFDMDFSKIEYVKKRLPNSVAILLLPDRLNYLEQRLQERKSAAVEINDRMSHNTRVMNHLFLYDFIVVNALNQQEKAAQQIAAIANNSSFGSNKQKFVEHIPSTMAATNQDLFSQLGIIPFYDIMRSIPEFKETDFSECQIREVLGLTNVSIAIAHPKLNRSYVLRIPQSENKEFINRKNELFFLEIAQQLRLYPARIYHRDEAGLMLVGYIPHETTLTSDILKSNPEYRAKAIQALKLLHTIKYDEAKHNHLQVNLSKQFRVIKEKIQAKKIELPEQFWINYEKVMVILSELEKTIHKSQYVLSHMDPTPYNFLITTDKNLALVDYEFSGFYDKFFDLANFSTQSNFTDQFDEELFNNYFKQQSVPGLARLNCYKPIVNMWLCLWFIYKREYGYSSFNYKQLSDLFAIFYNRVCDQLKKIESQNLLIPACAAIPTLAESSRTSIIPAIRSLGAIQNRQGETVGKTLPASNESLKI